MERPFGRQRYIRAENIETDLQETGWQTWIGMIWLKTWTWGRILQTWWNFVFDIMWRVCQWAKEPLASQGELYPMKLSSQSVSWLPIIRYLVSFPCIYWRSLFLVHTTLTMLSSIMKIFSSSLCTTIPELWLPGAAQSSVSVTKWLTRNWHSSSLLISVSERKHTDHIYRIKHATLYRVINTHFYRALTVNNSTIKCE